MQWRYFSSRPMSLENTTVLPFLGGQNFLSSYVLEGTTLLSLLTLTIWLLLWKLRDRNDPTRIPDGVIFLALLFWKCLGILRPFAASSRSSPWGFINAAYSLAAIVTGGAGLAVVRNLIQSYAPQRETTREHHPWILPSRTTHTRMFPKKHSFAYSYLQVAVPIGFEGLCGSFISVGDVKKRGWLHVQGSDYLDRNSSKTTLEGKLSEYLQNQVRTSIVIHNSILTLQRGWIVQTGIMLISSLLHVFWGTLSILFPSGISILKKIA